jgi:hypothetical protein
MIEKFGIPLDLWYIILDYLPSGVEIDPLFSYVTNNATSSSNFWLLDWLKEDHEIRDWVASILSYSKQIEQISNGIYNRSFTLCFSEKRVSALSSGLMLCNERHIRIQETDELSFRFCYNSLYEIEQDSAKHGGPFTEDNFTMLPYLEADLQKEDYSAEKERLSYREPWKNVGQDEACSILTQLLPVASCIFTLEYTDSKKPAEGWTIGTRGKGDIAKVCCRPDGYMNNPFFHVFHVQHGD